jgi:hypothetical protein
MHESASWQAFVFQIVVAAQGVYSQTHTLDGDDGA